MNDYKILFCLMVCILLSACGKKYDKTSAVRKDVTEMVFAAGSLEANNTYNLNAQTDGYLLEVNFEEGDLVKRGDLLAKIDNRENVLNQKSAMDLYRIAEGNMHDNAPAIAQAKNALLIARKQMERDSVDHLRFKQLLDQNSVSKTEYETYYLKFTSSQATYWSALESYTLVKQQAKQQLIASKTTKEINVINSSNNRLVAVVSGKVYKKFKQPGDYVRRGDVIATIGDPNLLYAKVNIDESNISKIKIGQEAIIQLNVNKQKKYRGRVSHIYPSFDDASQSFLCKIIFVDPLDFKITGSQLQSNIIIGKHTSALLIPRNYLAFDGTVMMQGQKEKIVVKTNFIGSDWAHVTSGIDEHAVLIAERGSGKKKDNSESLSLVR
jgi:HlyD family secretion protein